MARLLILTPAELTRDPRARRQAVVARDLGLEAAGVCGRISGETPAPLPEVAIVRVGRAGAPAGLRDVGGGPRAHGGLVRELRGAYRLARLAYRTVLLVRGGRRGARADVVHANDLDTLAAGWLLARRSRARLVYDAHELYSEFDVDPPRLYRRVALALEGTLARRASAVVTVSDTLADELAARLRLRDRPLVVLNVPSGVAARDTPAHDGALRAVYQGSFGTGRPFARLLAAARLAPGVRFTVRAVRVDRAALEREVTAQGLAGRVEIADQLPPDEAFAALAGHDVGVIFDAPVTLNGELSLPNKLFEYLAAGLAVVVPRLRELGRLVEEDRVGLTFEPGQAEGLAAALEELAADRTRLAELRANARRVSAGRYGPAHQERVLRAAWGLE
jgi:glycosyltransferase involved in cell wall biosynthesis